ncbi:MAG: helix-turn-helix domain-containing protein [Myxococcota bacterium]
MELTVMEAAATLGKSPRAIRYLISSGQLKARLVGRQWMIRRDCLPSDPAQLAQTQARRARIQQVVDNALHSAPLGPGHPRSAPLGKRSPASQPPHADGQTTTRSDTRQRRSSAFTLARLQLFATALELYEVLSSPPPASSPPGIPPHARLPEPALAMLEGLRALSIGYYQFDRGLKREAYLRARVCFARVASDLLTLEGSEGLRRFNQVCAAETGSRPAADALSWSLQALQRLEGEVLPGLARLLRRLERRSGQEGVTL